METFELRDEEKERTMTLARTLGLASGYWRPQVRVARPP
jgi:hypothetical protein